jgi:hypothetical protein
MRGNSRAIDGGFIKVMKFSFDMLEKAHPDIMAAAEDSDLSSFHIQPRAR